ncbi:dTDP-glucose 4,6-dehydratase [Marinobacter halodurans]|uniref:dTDP-glucose 4,6-dehydratase n=1 Tax=Marinobacter halodurans TaxID=2528979 RepID=A0ABY1ZNF0_9GAMM|nr:dTDP-glucose 4,6-dehydratase [Marinobacter halodurans]TBW56656.1 dTDP-glucose 4,6-dehydratase [Marinobacter halodurans]
MKVLVTGGAGFIGSALIRFLVQQTDVFVINLDKLTYAATPEALDAVRGSDRYRFEAVDICDRTAVERVFEQYHPDAIMHLAAESHVDRSIDGPEACVQTNVVGTFVLLEASRHYLKRQSAMERSRFRFHHISTDEVFGDLAPDALPFTEASPYSPSSPYAATKAASDHLVRAWGRTYGVPVVLSNCSNNYGPFQYPEKLIPLTIFNALRGEPLPLYGRGDQIRDWLHVDDHAKALFRILSQGQVGETYLVGGQSERTNLEVVEAICDHLQLRLPRPHGYRQLIRFVDDRPGHDRRYAVSPSEALTALGWSRQYTFESGIRQTVDWYVDNREWLYGSGADGSRQGAGGSG